nr:MAG TPA: hypothetical protein [Caudoviricetes sp.]
MHTIQCILKNKKRKPNHAREDVADDPCEQHLRATPQGGEGRGKQGLTAFPRRAYYLFVKSILPFPEKVVCSFFNAYLC